MAFILFVFLHLHSHFQEAEHAVSSSFVQLLRPFQGFINIHGTVNSRNDAFHSKLVNLFRAISHSAYNRHRRHAFLLAAHADAAGNLSKCRLPIDPALSGNYQIHAF